MCIDCVLTSPKIAQVDPGDGHLPEVVLSQLVPEQTLDNTLIPKNHKYALSVRIVSPYKDYNSLLRWQANIFVHIPLWNCINEGMKWFLVC
jgi:hypothetical protein